jgi:peptidyl-prolyl cis-trans isomerase C
MKLRLFCSILLPLGLLAQNPQQPKMTVTPIKPAAAPQPPSNIPPDAVILVIGDQKFTREQFELLIPKNMVERASQTERRRMAVSLANFLTLAAEARRQALDQSPYAKLNLEIVADQWLANELVSKEVRDKPLDEAAVKSYYDKNQAQFEQITARHILVRFHNSRVPLRAGEKDLSDDEARAKAQDLKKKLDAGADFAALAKAESDDTSSGEKGGLLNPFTHGQMVPEFDQAAFAAEVGKATDPIKSAFGYHIILVTDHKIKPLDEAKAEIERKLRPQVEQQYVEDVRTRTPVTIDESYFGRPEAPAPKLVR